MEQKADIIPGSVIEGTVQGITKFGAFIELPNGSVGLVHISEIADTYVRDVRDFLSEGDPVQVRVLGVDGKKIALSVKQARERERQNTVNLDDKINRFPCMERGICNDEVVSLVSNRAGDIAGQRTGIWEVEPADILQARGNPLKVGIHQVYLFCT
jgi:S1 RNA binding domain protein